MKGNKGAQGYVGVKLRKDGIGHGRFVHRLVLEAFVGPCPEGMEACHWDDNKENNNLWNLRWDTPKGNYRDAIRNGKMPLGETHGMSKLTETDVRFIRRNYPIGRAWDRQLKQRRVSLAARFGVTTALLGLIYKGKIWRHLAW